MENSHLERARIIVITGSGRGKTTSALGIAVRRLAHGGRVLLVRFAKAAASGELAFFAGVPGMTVVSGECGRTPPPEHPDHPRHVAEARSLFRRARDGAPAFDTVILDEICGMTSRGIIPEGELVDFLRSLRPDQVAVVTGRGAGLATLAVADTVSDIVDVKHAYARGVPAQPGVEH